ncbi:hypothetical protein MRX96_016970 [Rhipicephalus microplus]
MANSRNARRRGAPLPAPFLGAQFQSGDECSISNASAWQPGPALAGRRCQALAPVPPPRGYVLATNCALHARYAPSQQLSTRAWHGKRLVTQYSSRQTSARSPFSPRQLRHVTLETLSLASTADAGHIYS